MVKAFLIAAATIALLAGAITAIGAMLPPDHTATASATVPRSPETVYAAIRDAGAYPSWRADVARVDLVSEREFREHGPHEPVLYEIVVDEPPRKMVSRIADPDLPYSGSWTFELEPVSGGTQLTIVEHGSVSNPVFRFFSHYFFSPTETMETFLRSLQAHLAPSAPLGGIRNPPRAFHWAQKLRLGRDQKSPARILKAANGPKSA